MMKSEQRTTKIGSLAALLLFGVFMVCLLLVLLGGADIYQGLTERDRESFDRRTAAQYLTTRMRQADAAGCLRVETFGGETALVVTEQIEGETYETRIYCHEGYLRELFAAADYDAAPEDGERVLPLEVLELELQQGLLRARLVTPDGGTQELVLHCRSGEEVLP